MLLWITLTLLVGAVVVGYIAYVKIRDGTQPGEPFIDRMLKKIKLDRGETVPTTGVPEDEVQRRIAAAVQLAIEDTLRRVAQANLQGPR